MLAARRRENEGQVKYRVRYQNVENMHQPIGVASMRPVPFRYFLFPLI